MFRWYQDAAKCYVYLTDVKFKGRKPAGGSFQSWGPAFRNSRWFTRGWTLQELLAPPFVIFFSEDGTLLGDRNSLETQIHEITRISVRALQGVDLSEFSVIERFAWASDRKTKRGEDKAYCLLGIFDVSMPVIYGEGTQRALRRLRDEIHKLTAVQSLGSESLHPLEHHGSTRQDIAKRLLRHLRFSAIQDREDGIAEAVTDTFEWIFHDPPESGDYTWNSFVRWMEDDTALYWIAGKPGSGKSTLMKYLHLDPRTKEHLGTWAKNSKLVIAGHFFWNSGSSIQMSIEGLIRSLLHGVGEQLPDMLPYLFPSRWVEMESHPNLQQMEMQPWKESECLQAFRRILSSHFRHFRIFFFVDGLDECSGNLEELTRLLKEMSRMSHIKICLASRPWNVFQDAFNSNPSLTLQYLTSRDINAFVRTKFYEHPGFLELEIGYSELAAQLCHSVTRKASGVFLWVRLAVESLLRGMSDGDRVTDLMKRLEDLPEDLETLFQDILDSVDPAYKAHSSELFQIHRAASEYCDGISLLQLSFADDNDQALSTDEKTPLDYGEFIYRLKSMNRRLGSRTKGLLEANTFLLKDKDNLRPTVIFEVTHRPKVQYLHRTLGDYIEQPDIWNGICAVTPAFNPLASICNAYVVEIKNLLLNLSEDYKDDADIQGRVHLHVSDLLDKIMCLCHTAHGSYIGPLIPLLDALNEILTHRLRPEHHPDAARLLLRSPLLMSVAIRYDIHFWIGELLSRGYPCSPSYSDPPFIFTAIDDNDLLELPGMPKKMSWTRDEIGLRPSVKCLKILFAHGANPYEEYEGRSAWDKVWAMVCLFLEDLIYLGDFCEYGDPSYYPPYDRYYKSTNIQSALESSEDRGLLVLDEWLDVVDMFIEFGADVSLIDPDVAQLVPQFAKRYGLKIEKSGQLQRLCQILGIDYRNLKLGDDGRNESLGERVVNVIGENTEERTNVRSVTPESVNRKRKRSS